ncbi:MAG: DegT/DnrJ/EryC1/StrS family aminotransferase [Planctomycetes bacterium]|nr:DegT/DnrJ/EryC1/StrS family aminotransferase [Planctomycetota bacterium]
MPAWPIFEPDELAAVEAVLRSGRVNYWTGDQCKKFERAWSDAHGGVHALAMANGSLTLDAAMRALDIGAGDEVIVSPRSYVASAMCVVLAGAKPVFADVDADSGNVTVESMEAVRTSRTKACIPVHIAGWPCDMPGISSWGAKHGIHVIEDCAQAHGAGIDGRAIGTWGVFSSWSFCQDKIMTTGGEGGMLCTPDLRLWKKAWQFAQHGKDYDLSHAKSSELGFRWLVRHEGTNLRMTEMQAAIGLCQLRKLDDWVARRARNAAIMREALGSVRGLRVPETPEGHAHYRCMAYAVKSEAKSGESLAKRRNSMLSALAQANLPASVGSCSEVYREPIFAEHGLAPKSPLPVAHALGESSLAFLVHHTIDEMSMHRHAAEVRDALQSVDAVQSGSLRRG